MMESLCLTEEMVDCTLTAGRTSFSAHRMVGNDKNHDDDWRRRGGIGR